MNKAFAVVLIVGFAFVDFLFFHDIFKPGESATAAQYLTGILSVLVFAISARILTHQNAK